MQDLLVLRHLFFSRIGQLTAERIKLMQQMAENSQHLSDIKAWAEQLQQNIQEEHQMYLTNLVAIYLGVSAVYAGMYWCIVGIIHLATMP